MKKHYCWLLAAAAFCGGGAAAQETGRAAEPLRLAYHGTAADPAAAAHELPPITEPQREALAGLFSAFPDTGALLSAQREVDGRIQQQKALSAQQQEALRGLFAAFSSAESLAAARAAVVGEINEKRGEVIAELHGKDSLPTFGGADGEKALVVEFSDYQCGYCKRMFGVLRGENVRVKVVEFPILGPISRTASEYALAAEKQNLYAEYHIALMSQGRLSEEALLKTAKSVGLDVEKLKTDSKSEEVAEKIQENFRMARLLGVRGTPFLVIGDQSVPGAVSKERLREMLNAKK
ncbi:MAG: DsbA family protein [Betaproteobacteria bacterium]|nr:DsbA family protein [Betaproteobacteria bacterium]